MTALSARRGSLLTEGRGPSQARTPLPGTAHVSVAGAEPRSSAKRASLRLSRHPADKRPHRAAAYRKDPDACADQQVEADGDQPLEHRRDPIPPSQRVLTTKGGVGSRASPYGGHMAANPRLRGVGVMAKCRHAGPPLDRRAHAQAWKPEGLLLLRTPPVEVRGGARGPSKPPHRGPSRCPRARSTLARCPGDCLKRHGAGAGNPSADSGPNPE